jgi:hypothetical protein
MLTHMCYISTFSLCLSLGNYLSMKGSNLVAQRGTYFILKKSYNILDEYPARCGGNIFWNSCVNESV